jgi:pimeloyl-ACP methyl ester carboxylesterase
VENLPLPFFSYTGLVDVQCLTTKEAPLTVQMAPKTPSVTRFENPLRIKDLGVWGLDYSTLTTASCPNFSIPEAARAIRAQVEASGLFERYEQVIVIGYSMGGLIAKSMLLEWQTSGDPDGMLAKTIGVFLLGVPSQGSPVAQEPGFFRYIVEALNLDKLRNLCRRQARDLFAGDENTYLFNLERNWENLLGSRRAASQSQAPLVYCAYETIPAIAGVTIVDKIYTSTQCSQSAFPINAMHSDLPKPRGPDDDVHRAWLGRSLDDLFRQWATWGFARFQFSNSDTFDTFARRINAGQQAFSLKIDQVPTDVALPHGVLEAPSRWALVSKAALEIGSICLDTHWAEDGAKISMRPAGGCNR